jgi:hypothetical protein
MGTRAELLRQLDDQKFSGIIVAAAGGQIWINVSTSTVAEHTINNPKFQLMEQGRVTRSLGENCPTFESSQNICRVKNATIYPINPLLKPEDT